jgi:hypothetical protein
MAVNGNENKVPCNKMTIVLNRMLPDYSNSGEMKINYETTFDEVNYE